MSGMKKILELEQEQKYEEAEGELEKYFTDWLKTNSIVEADCECGEKHINSGYHSTWCPVYKIGDN